MQAFLIMLIILLLFMYFQKYTEYKQVKYLYDKTNDINDKLLKVSERLTNYEDIDILYQKLLEDTVKLIKGANLGSILIYNKEKDVMEFKAAFNFNLDELKKITFKKEELFLYKSSGLKQPEIIKNPAKFDSKNVKRENYEMLCMTKSLDIRSTLSCPLYIDNEFYGQINVDNDSDENAFDSKDIRLILYISRQLEIAIKNTLLMNKLVETTRVDMLTGIFNRRYFEEVMNIEIKKAERYGNTFTLIMIDIDGFKLVNDNYGHNMGDEVLKHFVKAAKEKIRSSDIIARYAGDEFIIILNSFSEKEAGKKINSIRKYLKENPCNSIKIEFSAGACQFKKGMGVSDIINNADMKMYRDKRNRKVI